MKQKLKIEAQLPLAVTAAHCAYYGRALAVRFQNDQEMIQSFEPPEDVLSFDPAWLAGHPGSGRCERMQMFFAEERLRRRAIYHLIESAGPGKLSKGHRSLREELGSELVCQVRDHMLNPPPTEIGCAICPVPTDLICQVQQWQHWDAFERDGWIHENVESALDELEEIWRPAVAIAIRLKAEGKVLAGTIRRLCGEIFGKALEGDRERAVISRFCYDLVSSELPLVTELIDQIPYARAAEDQYRREESEALPYPSVVAKARAKMDCLDSGADAGAAAARLLMVAYNGSYCVAQDRLCWVSLPVALDSGQWKDISQPRVILHPLPDDYALCARISLHFLLSGYVWAGMNHRARAEEERDIDVLVNEHLIPVMFKMFYVLASPNLSAPDLSLKQAAGIYSRLVALQGWFNPHDMREHLREIFRETYRILVRFREEVIDLEEGIKHGLLLGPGDILGLCGTAKDGRFQEDQRFGILMEYQRERAWRYFEHSEWQHQGTAAIGH